MFSTESRRIRRSGRDRRRPDIRVVVEALEERQLLAYNALGVSLPDLTVSGFAAPVASWSGTLAVTVNVSNIGANTMLDPLSLAPGSTGPSDVPASTVTVYASRTPNSLKGAVFLDTIDVPSLTGNDVTQVTHDIILPQKPAGFPGDGGKIYLTFKVNADGSVLESDTTNNQSKPVGVTIEAPLPELAAVGLDVPPTMQPGDTIQPNIRIANFGPAGTAAQGYVQVALVASTTPTFTSGSSIVALYTLKNSDGTPLDIPSQSLVPSKTPTFADANLDPTENIITIAGDPVTLPASPAKYYLGVVVDPYNQIKELKKVPQYTKPSNVFELPRTVGPPIAGLPPAGVVTAGGVSNVTLFPNPIGGNPVGGLPNGGGFPVPYPPVSLSSVASTSTSSSAVSSTSAASAAAASKSSSASSSSSAARLAAQARRQAVIDLLNNTNAPQNTTGVLSATTLKSLATLRKLRGLTV